MLRHITLLLFAACFVTGCNVQTGISPTETVIADSSDRDFGFEGTWLPMHNRDVDGDVDSYEMTIARNGDYTAIMQDPSGNAGRELTVRFRAHEMSKDKPHAIVEIELTNDGKIAYRRLAIAAVKDNHLNLWMIDGRKIGEHLYKDGVPAVIEHFSFSSTVRCDSKKLLESLTSHSREIVGEVQTFKRKPVIGRQSVATVIADLGNQNAHETQAPILDRNASLADGLRCHILWW